MYKRRVAEVLLDFCLIPLPTTRPTGCGSRATSSRRTIQFFIQSLPIVLVAQLIALFVAGGYRGTWRYFGMMDAVVFAKGVVLGTVAAQVVILYALPVRELFARRLRDRRRAADAAAVRSRGVVQAGRRVHRRRTAVGQRCVIYGTAARASATIREAFGDSR